ncbi:MAG: hypothetical protein RLZZ165_207 [Bacteroidota bacterium]|jgi:hypothetical protein
MLKDLLAHLFQFALFYGIQDRERFHTYVSGWLSKYQLDHETSEQFIDYAYEFLVGFANRLRDTQVVESGVHKGVAALEQQMEALNEKLEKILHKMPEN